MQSMLNIHGPFGPPLCLSGHTHHPLPHITHEIEDHDRRREAMKRERAKARDEIRDGELAALLHDLSLCYLANCCIAKAA